MATGLTAKQLEGFTRQLDERQDVLRRDIADELARSEHEPYNELAGQVGDLEDQALADLLVDENLAIVHRSIEELRAVEAAMQRTELGTYGVCIDCGDDIGVERLKANPTALRCYDCQSVYERTHAHEGHPTL